MAHERPCLNHPPDRTDETSKALSQRRWSPIVRSRCPQQNQVHRHGIAMVLVMVCVAGAVILGLAFITSSSTTSSSTETAESYFRARHVSESGLDMVLTYTDANPMWRGLKATGNWVSNYPVDGGTYSADAQFTTNPRDPLYLTVTGSYGSAQHRVEATLDTVGHVWGAAVKETIVVKNQSDINSFNSAIGPYSLTNSSSDAAVTTNATFAGAVKLESFGYIKGDVWIGAGGNPDTVVSQALTATVSGTVDDLPANMIFPEPPPMPTNTGSNRGVVTLTSGTTKINSNRQYDSLTLDSSAIIEVTGDVIVRVNNGFTAQGFSRIDILPGAKLTLYVGKLISFGDFTQVNHTGDTKRMVIHGLGTGYNHMIQNQVHVCAAIIAPHSTLTVRDRANFYGVFVGKSLNVTDYGYMHVDRNPALLGADLNLPMFPTGMKLRQVTEK